LEEQAMPAATATARGITDEEFHELAALGAALLHGALSMPALVDMTDSGASPGEIEGVRICRAASIAMQGLLAAAPLSPKGTMVAMAIALGSYIGQQPMQTHSELYKAFSEQLATALAAATMMKREAFDG
jgi:hypothetical protein